LSIIELHISGTAIAGRCNEQWIDHIYVVLVVNGNGSGDEVVGKIMERALSLAVGMGWQKNEVTGIEGNGNHNITPAHTYNAKSDGRESTVNKSPTEPATAGTRWYKHVQSCNST